MRNWLDKRMCADGWRGRFGVFLAAAFVVGGITGCEFGWYRTGEEVRVNAGSSTANSGQIQGSSEYACVAGDPSMGAIMPECGALPMLHRMDNGKLVANHSKLIWSVVAGQSNQLELALHNVRSLPWAAALVIKKVEFLYAATEAPPAAGCFRGTADGVPCKAAKWSAVVPKGISPKVGQADVETIVLTYLPADNLPRSARLELHLRGVGDPADRTLTVDIAIQPGAPALNLQPSEMLIPYTQQGYASIHKVVLTNLGTAPARVLAIDLLNLPPDFAVQRVTSVPSDEDWLAGGTFWAIDLPWMLPPGGAVQVDLRFTPKNDKPKSGVLKFVTDAAGLGPLTCTVQAYLGVPALCITPNGKYSFGKAGPGAMAGSAEVTLKNCGSVPVVVTDISLDAALTTATGFSLDLSDLEPLTKDGAGKPSEANPATVEVNGKATFTVLRAPGGSPGQAVVRITNNAWVQPQIVFEVATGP